jgi:hypothetical protein
MQVRSDKTVNVNVEILPSRATAGPSKLVHRIAWIITALALLAVISFHFRVARAELGSDLIGYDQSRHYVTGVMTFDYVRHGLGSNPLKFAEAYFARFPKVSMGHWPPVYYAVQALWYFVAGPLPVSLRVLSALLAVAAAVVMLRRTSARYGPYLAALGAIVYLGLPAVQVYSWDTMAETLLALLVLLAALALAEFLENPSPRAAAWFVCWSVLAILTKGSAWSLGLMLCCAPLLAGRLRVYRSPWFWLSGAAIAILGAPFYLLVWRLRLSYNVNVVESLGKQAPVSGLGSLGPLPEVVPLIVIAFGVLGLGAALYSRFVRRSGDRLHTETLVMAACVLAQILFLAGLPITYEGRFYFPAAAPLVLLFLAGIRRIQSWCGAVSPAVAILVPAAAIAAIVWSFGPADLCPQQGYRGACPAYGYRAAMDSIPERRQGPVILVSSDHVGEGAMVAARLADDPARSSVVLDARRLLGIDKPLKHQPEPPRMSVDEVLRFLNETPVNYLIVEKTGWGEEDLSLLDQTLHDPRFAFALRSRFPVVWGGDPRIGTLLIFENPRAGDRFPTSLRFKLSPNLGSREVRLSPSD